MVRPADDQAPSRARGLCQAHVDRWDEYVSLFEQVIDSFAPEG